MRSIEWCHLETVNLDFKVTYFEYEISRKWCQIEL